MDRKQAEALVGNLVIINENDEGQYIGELKQVITAPRKPWRGLIKIISVHSLPKPTFTNRVELGVPIYSAEEVVEIAGSKIIASPSIDVITYEEGLTSAITNEIELIIKRKQQNALIYEALTDYLREVNPAQASSLIDKLLIEETVVPEDEYLYYTLENRNNSPILVEDLHRKEVPLEGCPFEFELKTSRGWTKGTYYSDWTFEALSGKKYKLKEEKKLRLNKKHLEPYQLFLNELDKPALHSFEHFLKTNALSHNQVLTCHNSLIRQLLFTSEQKEFSGTNFITYQAQHDIFVIQHHYERKLNDGIDTVYDRFELTSSTGKRSIVTYTNSFTSGK
ncbi:DUF2777 family protein [Alkalihalobacterium alkalinitrilicum]|uniref:DUF2777 family protein n=1 Tax=Alkalihalobacterium alkalinitrilicum TaxID=427920 RepID=UPI0009958769|nr:DUF2777 family protein [Alkalihalobacterium alkalinitrilicum]